MAFTEIRGIRTAYDVAGEGPAVVLLHGFPLNRSMWREQVKALSPRFRVITPDLRGHGESAATTDPAHMDEMARDLAALMDHLSIDSAVIAGLSMGGYVAFSFYRLFRERADALILADTRAGADSDERRRNRETQAIEIANKGIEGVVETLLPKLLAPDTLSRRPALVARVREMMAKTRPQGAISALHGMAARRDHTPLLGEIDVPTLIIVGSYDSVTPIEDAEELHRGVRGSQLEIIHGAGHLSNLEQPAEFSRVVAGFLDA